MQTALHLELAKAKGHTASLLVADVYKAFDQICRPLAYTLLAKAGFPPALLWAYGSFLEGLTVRNAVGQGLGKATVRPAAIPQGDPWSMLTLGVIITPWLRMLAETRAIPRALADDLSVYLEADPEQPEEEHLEDVAQMAAVTGAYICDMGGKPAPGKTVARSSSKGVRKQKSQRHAHPGTRRQTLCAC